ncbi:unnamed protein product, partial [Ectocarpus sp. 13 AM-2016]
MVARGTLLSVATGLTLNQAPRVACFCTVVLPSAHRARVHQARATAVPHGSSRWNNNGFQGGARLGSAASLVRLRAVEEPAAAA